MTEAAEGGAELAWRLLATLEGGSLLLTASAFLVYTARNMFVSQNRNKRNIRNVLVTNTTNTLGRELKTRLEAHGCVVETLIDYDVTGPDRTTPSNKVDAIVIVGAETKREGLEGMDDLVNEDVHDNLRLLESVSSRLRPGGYIAWSCTKDSGATGAFADAGAAFDTVLEASLTHIAKLCECEAVWVGRRVGAVSAAEHTVSTLLSRTPSPALNGFSVRNAAHRLGEYLGRWLKILT